MRTRRLSLVLSALGAAPWLALGITCSALASESLLLTPRPGLELGPSLSAILEAFPDARVTPVFGPGEALALRALGETGLAESLKITVGTLEEKRTLSLFGASHGIPLEDNASPEFQDSALERLRWGIRNQGLPQKLTVAEFKSQLIAGVAGEDIGAVRFRELRSRAGAPVRAGGPHAPKGPVVVAVLDTGVDAAHPELGPAILRKESECRALEEYRSCKKGRDTSACDSLGRADTDGNGYPMDCQGWNVTGAKDPLTGVLGDAQTSDDLGHGTHVAGIVRSVVAHAGADSVRILPVKVIRRSPNAPIRPQVTAEDVPSPVESSLKAGGTFADLLARGMLYAIRSGAQVINLSLAWPRAADSELMRRMTALAQARGILVVAAAGNDSTQAQVMPCAYSGVVCVAAHGPDGALSHFSNFGTAADLAAPGLGILSAWPSKRQPVNLTGYQGYDLKNGTSMASPFVAGALSALIDAGISASEAVSRLYASARAPLSPDWENPGLPEKFTQSGNADLARALEIAPGPWLERADKAPLRLELSESGRVPFAFELSNRWKPASGPISVRARVLPWESTQRLTARLPELGVSEWQFEGSGTRRLEGELRLPHGGATETRFLIELEARAPGYLQRLTVPAELSRTIDWAFASGASSGVSGPRGLSLPLSRKLPEDISLRSVTAKDGADGGDAGLEFLALRSAAGRLEISLVSARAESFEVSSPLSLPGVPGELYSIQRIRPSEYAMIFRLPPPAGSTLPSFRFLFLSKLGEALALTREISHDNKVSAIPDRFQWMRSVSKDGAPALVPAWIGIGTTPALEKKPFDPWNPKPTDEPTRRLYYLSAEGLRSLETGEDEFWIELLASPAAGDVRALLGRGDDYRIRYSVDRLEDGKRVSSEKLELSRFRMLEGIYQSAAVVSLSGSGALATAFSGAGVPGSLRTTVLPGDGRASVDVEQRPLSRLDSVMRTVGVFDSPSGLSTFSETHYSLQFEDHATGRAAATSLGRFSFLPTFIFSQNFFPVVAFRPAAEGARERIPAVLIPAELGQPDGMEIALPAESGAALGISRPAGFRLQAQAGCQWIGNPAPASATGPSSVLFLCGGSRMVRVPLDLSFLESF